MTRSALAHRLVAPPLLAALALAAPTRPAGAQDRFQQTNLVSDVPGLAQALDPQLQNPWGIALSPTSPFWVSDNGTGVSTLYNGSGVKQGLVVTIPGVGAAGAPTGVTFNNTGSFALANGGNAAFLFADEGGTIAAWNPAAGTTAVTAASGDDGSSYKGITVAGSGAGARLFAANFGLGRVDVFDASFAPILSGGFADPNLPAGYAPFNVQNIGGSIYVTYALRDPTTGDDVAGAGHGFVDVFDVGGNLQRRLVSDGLLDSPWGMALAPQGFGGFGGALLVGNFGDGTIHAYDPLTGTFIGQVMDASGDPLVNDGLWGLTFGNGAAGGSTGVLYFTAGIQDEAHGLFGSIAPVNVVPEPGTLGLVATGLGTLLTGAARRRRRPR